MVEYGNGVSQGAGQVAGGHGGGGGPVDVGTAPPAELIFLAVVVVVGLFVVKRLVF